MTLARCSRKKAAAPLMDVKDQQCSSLLFLQNCRRFQKSGGLQNGTVFINNGEDHTFSVPWTGRRKWPHMGTDGILLAGGKGSQQSLRNRNRLNRMILNAVRICHIFVVASIYNSKIVAQTGDDEIVSVGADTDLIQKLAETHAVVSGVDHVSRHISSEMMDLIPCCLKLR